MNCQNIGSRVESTEEMVIFTNRALEEPIICALVAFAPVGLFVALVDAGAVWNLGIKIVLLISAFFLFRWLATRLSLLELDEKDMLRAMLERRGLGVVARMVLR